MSDWCISVSNKVNKSILGDVLSIEFTNKLGVLWTSGSLPVWSLIISGIISIIVWETFIKGGCKGDSSWVIWIMNWWVSNILWDSSDHHRDGDVVVVRLIFLLISVFLQDRVEGIVTNNLSETFEGNRFDMVEIVGWGNLKSNSFNLIDWDIEVLGPFLPFSSIGSFGGEETLGSWGIFFGLFLGLSNWSSWGLFSGNSNILSMNWFMLMVMLFVVMLLVVFVGL